MNNKKRLIIIDSNSVIHRAFHALPPLATKKGEPVNAIYGFLLVFLKAIKEFQPDYIAACFDVKGATFRHKRFKAYKAKRPPMPENLSQQIPKIKEILAAFNIQIFEKEGFEADDMIGTIARLAPKKQIVPPIESIILSSDLDTLQLVDPKTMVYLLRKGVKDTVLYDENSVKEKYQGLSPRQLLDFRALRGDPSDNIPGVSGIGEKTAIELLIKFGDLENLYKEIGERSLASKKIRPKVVEILSGQKEQAEISRSLAEICKDAPVDFNLLECKWGSYEKDKIIKIFEELEFYTLMKRLPEPAKPVEIKNNVVPLF